MRVLLRIFLVLACLFAAILLLIAFIYRDRRPRIYFAAETGDTNSIALYLASGSNVNANINCYRFAANIRLAPLLDIALENGQIETADFLLKKGADPNQPDSRGETPLMWMIGFSKNGVGQEKRTQMFKMLLNAGANPNAPSPTEYRHTPLIKAASLGETELARVLLNAGAAVKATNKIGQTALHLAGGDSEVASLLLAAGADVSARDAYGDTPVDYAIRGSYVNTLNVLRKLPASTNH